MRSVAEANLARVREMFDAAARRDPAGMQHYDPEITWDARGVQIPEMEGVFHGLEQVRRWWIGWYQAWETIDIVDGPRHLLHGNQVISWWRQRMRGRESGIDVELDCGFIWTFQGGSLVHAAGFLSHDDLFEAAEVVPEDR